LVIILPAAENMPSAAGAAEVAGTARTFLPKSHGTTEEARFNSVKRVLV